MAKVWKNNTWDTRDLVRRARKGDVYYTIVDIATNLARHEEPQLVGRWKVTSIQAFTGAPMCGAKSLEQVLHESGLVYAEKPKGIRGTWEPSPQVSGPLGGDTERYLDEPEIKGMKKLADEAADRRRKSRSGRRGWL